jgi:RNA polymerase sigma-70 factor (ECF subfamily)
VLGDAAEPADAAAGAAEQFERHRDAAGVRRALMLLRDDQRELIILARYRGMRYDAIADLLGIEVGAVKVRMHRAVKELRDIFLQLSEKPCNAKQSENGLLMV